MVGDNATIGAVIKRAGLAFATYVLVVGIGWFVFAVVSDRIAAPRVHDGQAFLGFWLFGSTLLAVGAAGTLVFLLWLRDRAWPWAMLTGTIAGVMALAYAVIDTLRTVEYAGRTFIQGPGEGLIPVTVMLGIAVIAFTALVVRPRARRQPAP